MAENEKPQVPKPTERVTPSVQEDVKSRLDDMETLSRPGARPGSAPAKSEGPPAWTQISTPPRLADMAVAARQLSVLLNSGITLLQSLRILAQRSQHPHLKRTFKDVVTRIERGESLTSALSAHPRIFSPLFIGVARIGEAAGILDRGMQRLAEVLEQRLTIRRQIRSALAYPVVALCVAFIVLLLIFGVAIPKFATIYRDQNVALPGITQVILSISDFVKGWPLLYIPVLIVLLILFLGWNRTASGKSALDSFRLRFPVLGLINRKIQTARVSRTLSNLLEAGIPLLESIRLTASTAENLRVAEALGKVHENVERGGKIEPPLRQSAVFPDIAIDMVAVGDEAGSLDYMLKKIADNYETEVEATLRGIASIIEPVLIMILGGVVLLIALGALLPYFQLAAVIGE